MSRVTLKVCLKPDPNANKEHVVRIRITKDRTPRYWALNISVPKSTFNEKGTFSLRNWINSKHPDYKTYNERIREQYRKAEKAVEQFEKDEDAAFTVDQVISFLKLGGKPDLLIDYFQAHLDQRRKLAGSDLQKIRTWREYGFSFDRLKDFLTDTKRLKLPVRLLTKEIVLEYRTWLSERYAHNTITLKLACLRKVAIEAMKDKYFPFDKYPFDGVSTVFKRKTVVRLKESEIDLMTEGARTGRQGKYGHVTDREHARPCALLMYYMQGIRIGDFVLLRRSNYSVEDGQHRIKYTMGKSDKVRNVLLPPEAVELIQPYLNNADGTPKKPKDFLFPYTISTLDKLTPDEQIVYIRRATTRLGLQMKRLASQVGIDKTVTPHIMRHSFADLLRRNGVDLLTIQMTLGHSDPRTTRGYLEAYDLGAVDSVVDLYKRKTIGKQSTETTRKNPEASEGEGIE
ncbi:MULTISPECIES: site-specific integrase [unclassified Spirosoma]|uniref:tyrosine-type recombinase/integrase n=1 Tax=unclassified Spirosoma TaxID=2621999 RepID=UPI00095D640D|nr:MULTISPECIES: site-specific integrase [unclassified Spirosoma]MBN8826477.1 site-specific integrase [Spirosoma sp.]OJW76430.1 MAG: hypothetical protein BGO59_23235 [Spirosoma sp. 48-14]